MGAGVVMVAWRGNVGDVGVEAETWVRFIYKTGLRH